jgi:DNA-binding helix-hairpin-helix protein with protein kinase domain
VAKVYHKVPAQQTEAKLRTMVALARDELIKVAAWPTATLHERAGGPTVGLMMRRIKDFKEIHILYSPAHRKTPAGFPQADWRFLVTVAMNCAAAMENVHQFGVVVGDVNQSNFLVSAAGLVALIDCDSFQVQVNGRTYPCEVGVPLFTPPELQNQSFRGLVRTPNHDRFGLAVLLFHLLFMGRHPFSGRFLGQGDMPIERAIAEYRFAYGASARAHGMQPPLHALTLSAVSPQLIGHFERAFARVNTRPSGAEWFGTLKAFLQSLRPCQADPGHFYPTHLTACCWCDLMRQGSPNFFVSVAYSRPTAVTGPAFVLKVVWARIEQLPPPDVTYRRPPTPSGGRPIPLPPGVSAAPPAKPAKPSPPPILVSPPAAPPMTIPTPSRQRVIVRPEDTQIIIGVVALGSLLLGIGFLPLGVKFLAIAGLISFLGFGSWWATLEFRRRKEIRQANREYDEEVAVLRAEATRRRQEWENQLSVAQADARQQYELELSQYKQQLHPWKILAEKYKSEVAKRKRAREEAEQRLKEVEAEWSAVTSWHSTAFVAERTDLRKLRQRHEDLTHGHALERQQLQARVQEMQREAFLQQYFISDATIEGIGPTRKATLASFGIETASDVERNAILQVPGFGEKLTQRLLCWRQEIERQFVFNPAIGLPPREQQALDIKYATARQPVEAQLLAGEGKLRAILNQAERDFQTLYERIRSCLQLLAQAELDLKVFRPGV